MYEEESLIAIICLIIAIKKRKLKRQQSVKRLKKRRELWSRKWLLERNHGKDLSHLALNELQLEDEKGFKNFTRMTPTNFKIILKKVEPLVSKQDTVLREAIPASTRLLITLRFLAVGSTYSDLSFSFRVSVQAISLIIPETLAAIYSTLKKDFLKVPQSSTEWKAVAKDFEDKWNFPMCLGAIDGKHIAIRCKKEDGSMYFNYKGFNSVILMAIVDANYKFLYVDVGTNGRANDSATFNQSTFYQAIKNNSLDFPEDQQLPNFDKKVPYVFIADDAFRLSSRILKPHGQRSHEREKIFNYRLSRARRVVENAFGILSNRFQIFQKDINLDVDKVEQITLTACALHNFLRCEEGLYGTVDTEDVTTLNIQPGSWRSTVLVTGMERSAGNRASESGINVRNIFTEYFNGSGAVPWQGDAIKKFNF